jgi:peptidoglycan/xylan/chitin deacetylase (PgdA/CDA1 family)
MTKGSEILRQAARWIPPAALRPFGRPVALFFHGVTPHIHDSRIEINQHARDAFRRIAVQLKRDFQVLPLEALDDALAKPERHRRTVFLMSDDGYANTLEFAADILEEQRLPWTLFVSTQHIDTGELNPLILARLFLHFAPDGCYAIPHLPQAIILGAPQERARLAASLLSTLRRLPVQKAEDCFAAMKAAFPAGKLDELRARFPSERFLGWNDVRSLHARGVEIGAHAQWHWPMNDAQSPDTLRTQAEQPRAAIMSRLGACRYFAYPFGNVGDVSRDAWRVVRDAGYSHAFTTLSGTLRRGLNPWLLPRYGLRAEEPHLPSLLPLLRAADRRLARLTAAASGRRAA